MKDDETQGAKRKSAGELPYEAGLEEGTHLSSPVVAGHRPDGPAIVTDAIWSISAVPTMAFTETQH
ncbi:hypothetical protein ACH37Y_13660 [Sphingomonas paucimobilis]|uniref:hypothetical protein n=1 Tax=Sphingomonas paucimobilis TaxID=13689 RepID=UPI0037A19E3A